MVEAEEAREMKSNQAGRNATDRFSAAMGEAESVLDEAHMKGTAGRLPKFLLFLLWDAYRTAVSAQVLVQQALTDWRIPADCIELLTRQILERAILSSYARKHASAAVVDRFIKTSAREWERWWQPRLTANEEKELSAVKELPNYRQMAEDVGGDLYEIYGKLSYLIHPRAAQPYTLVEHESGLSPEEFFRRRIENILPVTASLLTILTSNFSESQEESTSTSSSP